ncbi:MAG: branched-chain amino acid transport system permease protein [Actinomycetota bacterium]|jgi:branched-chain amino acid transport system permease protein|nr:branched-chain amino acid transport system permease protein [Actinomycetota bacterium]
MQFYVTEVLVLFCVNVIAIWGLDLQFGVTGINNFAYVIFQAAGAYTAAVVTLGPASSTGFQHYVGGTHLPYPASVVVGSIFAGILAVPIGFIGLSRLRGDYQAIVMLVVSVIAVGLTNAAVKILNGPAGLSTVPRPLFGLVNSEVGYAWFYVFIAAVWALLAFLVVRAITSSPLGRILRAVRDSDSAAAALGKDVIRLKMLAFVIGGMIAGASGAVYVQYLGAWGPGSWQYAETFLFLTAIVVGGTGNMAGAVLGAILVPIAFQELTRFVPNIGYPGLVESLQWVLIGLLMLGFLWFRPRGLLPERRRTFPGSRARRVDNTGSRGRRVRVTPVPGTGVAAAAGGTADAAAV